METYDPTSAMYSSYGQLLNQILETMKTLGIDKKSIGELIDINKIPYWTSRKLNGTIPLVYSEAIQIIEYLGLPGISKEEFDALTIEQRKRGTSKPKTTPTSEMSNKEYRAFDIQSLDVIIANSDISEAEMFSDVNDMFRNSRKDYISNGIGRSLVLYTLMARILHLQKKDYTTGLLYEIEEARKEEYITKNIKPQYREQARGYRDKDGFGWFPEDWWRGDRHRSPTETEHKENERRKDIKGIEELASKKLTPLQLLSEVRDIAELLRQEYLTMGNGQTLIQYERVKVVQAFLGRQAS